MNLPDRRKKWKSMITLIEFLLVAGFVGLMVLWFVIKGEED